MEEVAAIAKAWCTFEETLSSFICRSSGPPPLNISGPGARRGSSTTAAALATSTTSSRASASFGEGPLYLRGAQQAASGSRPEETLTIFCMRVAGDDAQCRHQKSRRRRLADGHGTRWNHSGRPRRAWSWR